MRRAVLGAEEPAQRCPSDHASGPLDENSGVLLETASALLRLRPHEDVRVVLTFATGPRSEVQIIRTAAGKGFVAKQYVGEDARRRFVA